MKKTILFTLAAGFLFTSCKKQTPQETAPLPKKIALATWLLGSWENSSAEGNLVEHWHKVNDSVFHGESYFIAGKDTLFAETVVLDDIDGNIGYTVTVPGQNEEKPVRFGMTSITGKEIIFQNPAHDYPDKIRYTHPTEDSLVAFIYGKKDGKPATEVFKMKKKQ